MAPVVKLATARRPPLKVAREAGFGAERVGKAVSPRPTAAKVATVDAAFYPKMARLVAELVVVSEIKLAPEGSVMKEEVLVVPAATAARRVPEVGEQPRPVFMIH